MAPQPTSTNAQNPCGLSGAQGFRPDWAHKGQQNEKPYRREHGPSEGDEAMGVANPVSAEEKVIDGLEDYGEEDASEKQGQTQANGKGNGGYLIQREIHDSRSLKEADRTLYRSCGRWHGRLALS